MTSKEEQINLEVWLQRQPRRDFYIPCNVRGIKLYLVDEEGTGEQYTLILEEEFETYYVNY